MALKYGIFESEFLGLDTNNMPMYDRAVDESFLEMYCGGFFTDGIAVFVENCFQVISELGNKITVKPGLALLKGKMAYDQLDYTVDLPTSPATYSRYDRVVLRRDNVAREIKIMFLSGVENAAPVAPALVRTENVHDLCLATILRSPGDTVTQAKITDDRLNTSLCGVIAPKTNVLNTEALFAQFTAVFNEWFNGLGEILDENAAANLLNTINDHIADTNLHVSVEKQAAWDNLKTFQTAGGTGTAITLAGVELVDGFQTTFVIKTNNSGAATTINGKPLYKPGTTTSPKLIAGKAATVWYNLAGDCFFIKASAEGTATAEDVLAPHTFSNDDDIGLIGTLALTGDAVAADVVDGKMFYSDDAKNKLTGTNPYKSGMKISYDNLIPEMPLVPYKDLIPQWITSLESMYFDEHSNRLMIEVITSGERRIYVFDSDGNWLNNFIISPASSVYRVILYENNYFIFYNGGWAKHNPTGTLITSGTDFSLRTGDTDLRVERVSEHQIKAFQADGSVKRFNMATMTVDQTISLPNLFSGTVPFFDDAGNWYYHAASALITKFNANGDVVFSGAAHNFENLSTPTYKVFDVGAKVIASRVYNGYFRTKIVSTSDWSLINSQVSQVSTDTGLQCGYPNLASSKKLLFLKSTSTYYLYAIKLDDQAQGIQSTFGQILSTSNMVNGLYANSDDEVFISYLISGYPAVKKLKFNYQLS